MEIGGSSEGSPRPGWEPVETGARCAFCLQPVDDPVRTSCYRCHALYHADCWDANGARCAVYACDPAAWVTPRPPLRGPRPGRRRGAAAVPERSAASWSTRIYRMALTGMFLFAVQMVIRVSTYTTPDGGRTYYGGHRRVSSAAEEFSEVTRESRGLLYEVDRAEGRLPTVPSARSAMRLRAYDLVQRLQKALDTYEQIDRAWVARRPEWQSSLGRIRNLIVDLRDE